MWDNIYLDYIYYFLKLLIVICFWIFYILLVYVTYDDYVEKFNKFDLSTLGKRSSAEHKRRIFDEYEYIRRQHIDNEVLKKTLLAYLDLADTESSMWDVKIYIKELFFYNNLRDGPTQFKMYMYRNLRVSSRFLVDGKKNFIDLMIIFLDKHGTDKDKDYFREIMKEYYKLVKSIFDEGEPLNVPAIKEKYFLKLNKSHTDNNNSQNKKSNKSERFNMKKNEI